MKTNILSRLIAVFLIAGAALPFGALPAAAQQVCWDNARIQAAVSQGQIQPVSAVLAREGIPGSTQVLSVKVCEDGGRIVYVLAILEASGQARNLTVGAQ